MRFSLCIGNIAIQNLQVKCSSGDCTWRGKFCDVNAHTNTCQYKLVSCPLRCENKIVRKSLDDHKLNICQNRSHKCELCGKKGTYAQITGVHLQECPMKIIFCKKCNEEVERQRMQHHIDHYCEYTKISCKYKSIGCEFVTERKDMTVHESDATSHCQAVAETTIQLKQKLAKLEKYLAEQKETVLSLRGLKDTEKSIENLHLPFILLHVAI